MVRTAAQPPHASIAGGFLVVPVSELMAAWHACRSRPLGIGDFRAYLACREMAARRRNAAQGRTPSYGAAELAALLGVAPRRASASIRRLVAAGLIEWSESALEFPPAPPPGVGLADTIGRGTGDLAVPRRILRFLAKGARPALVATALGILLRCLSRRRAGWDGRGRLKVAWVAKAFAVSTRQVKAARAELAALGWVAPEPDDQWALNRWGRAYRIDLSWAPPHAIGGPRSSPPPAPPVPRSSPPDLHPEPSRREKNQEPAPGGPAGVEVRGGPGGKAPTPDLSDIRVEDLKETARTLELHRQAVARGLVGPSEADRLRVVAAAEHALAIGKANPAGLFRHLVAGRLWRYLTQEDEDRAVARLKRHDRPPIVGGTPTVALSRPPALSDDARLVREVRAAAISAGHYRDPFPLVAARDPSWTRERWDRALAEGFR